MNKKKYAILLLGLSIYIFISIGQERKPIEELETINGVGYDLNKSNKAEAEYSLPLSLSIFKADGSRINAVTTERGNNIGEVIQNRQRRLNKKFVQGQETVVLIGEEYARTGIKSIIEDRIRNPETNDRAFMAVCNGKSEEFFNVKNTGYSSASAYMEGLIEAARTFNFYSENFKLYDAYVRIAAEGRSLVLPFLDIKDEGIEMTGLAFFKEDKMVLKLDFEDSKALSFLKYDNVTGMASLQKSSKEYIDFEGKTGKRKVKCYKEGEKYRFTISIKFSGNVINNEMYSNITKDSEVRKKFEKDLEKQLEKECYEFINKMQNQYKMDCIGLGREAAAKFGRRKNIDWNEVVSNAKIDVNVKVAVDTQGRGDY
ncbi:Ger(x)C family spore germination protein [Clostridium omnivorum]|uniref:Spore germination protein n=1 Tax=Clostridium omnivorum TaxID=1604902 RepID=A0ABQ5N114_9CLOT|nr:Ger(x)C family spore germination protein [Clostridium sp. E14]GLC28905.1 spore germination protein [Clostridium sp. E14]